MTKKIKALGWVLSFIVSTSALAGNDPIPGCMDGRERLGLLNDQVLEWKHSTANQFQTRAFVQGNIVELNRDRDSHQHFIVQIGINSDDVVEIIHNKEFEEVNPYRIGDQVEVCGDYITSFAQAGRYPPSPAGAIIHWTHVNPGDRDGGRHPHGYFRVNGELFGDEVGGRPYRNPSFLNLMTWSMGLDLSQGI